MSWDALKLPYKTSLESPLNPALKCPLRTRATRSPTLLCHLQRTMCIIQRLVSHARHSFKNTLKDSFINLLERPLKNRTDEIAHASASHTKTSVFVQYTCRSPSLLCLMPKTLCLHTTLGGETHWTMRPPTLPV